MFAYQETTLKNVFCSLKECHDKIRLENIEDYLKANLSMMSVHKSQINVQILYWNIHWDLANPVGPIAKEGF